MSQLVTHTVQKVLTLTALPSVSISGVTGTDKQDVVLTPVGIDNNGVAKYRNLSYIPQIAQVVTFSSGISGSKVAARQVVQVPFSIDDGLGNILVKAVTVDVKISSNIGHTALQRNQGLVIALQMLTNLQADIRDGASPY